MEYRFEKVACNVCGSDEKMVLGLRGPSAHKGYRGYQGPQLVTNIVRCRRCGFYYPDPLPVPTEQKFTEQYNDPASYAPTPENDKKRHHLKTFERFLALTGKSSGKILDVGCGKGDFLSVAMDSGWEAVGIEPSQYAARIARSKGVIVKDGFLGDHDLEGDSFDAVWFSGVLEHVSNPRQLLMRAAEVLKPGGVVFIEVPNEDSLVAKVGNAYLRLKGEKYVTNLSPMFSPYHISGFTPKCISLLCEKCGLRVIDLSIVKGGNSDFYHTKTLEDKVEKFFRGAFLHIGVLLRQGKYMELFAKKA